MPLSVCSVCVFLLIEVYCTIHVKCNVLSIYSENIISTSSQQLFFSDVREIMCVLLCTPNIPPYWYSICASNFSLLHQSITLLLAFSIVVAPAATDIAVSAFVCQKNESLVIMCYGKSKIFQEDENTSLMNHTQYYLHVLD